MITKTVLILTSLLSFCFAQEPLWFKLECRALAEEWFIQARCYEMQSQQSLALKAYERAYSEDSSSFLKGMLLIRYLRAGRYDKIDSIPEGLINLDECNDGNKIAEFYCRISDTVRAFDLWKGLVLNAVSAHQLDSALILANSFAKNIPRLVPRTMQAYLMKKVSR